MKEVDAWVTTVLCDKDITGALVLAHSLRRTMTTKKMVVVASPFLESSNGFLLRKIFDQVICLDQHSLNGWIGLKDYAKFFCFTLTLFRKCVFLAPETLVLKNSDEIFDLPDDFNALVVRKKGGSVTIDTSVFSFAPSAEVFEQLLINGKKIGSEMVGKCETYLKGWLLNQKGFGKLSKKYNFKLSTNVTSMSDISIAKLSSEISDKLVSSEQPQLDGLVENGIMKYWKQLYDEDVACLVGDSKTSLNVTLENPTPVIDSSLLDSVAIIGISSRHAGANNLEEFWNLLMKGHSGIRTVPSDRWTKEHGCKAGNSYDSVQGGFISTPLDQFDSKFFGISPKEMEFMDPQQRLMLEVTWEALENAGIDPLSLRKTHTGIFFGAWMNDYKDLLMSAESDEFYRIYMGNSFGAAAARLSFFYGLTGPSIATESGCSSAMQSVDLACKSLRSGETSLSLACGVNLLLRPFNKDTMSFVIAGDGTCKTFDESADGFGRAEGVGVLVLKRYADAVRDGDNIWALIRGSSCVQEGLSRSMGTPTKECEALAMRLALKDAGVSPKDVDYCEAHGTGTPLGDPLEISAIQEVYGCTNERDKPLIVGSVKTNIGHTESCSGITGIIKVIASLHHEMIPPHLNLKNLNPKINFDLIPLRIPIEPIPWPKTSKPRLAAVSSFGITGTDGHLIIQETPDLIKKSKLTSSILQTNEDRSVHIMKLSARSNEALNDMISQYQKYLEANETCSFADISYTANVGRASFPYRAVVIAKDCNQASKLIQEQKCSRGEAPEGQPGKLCFLFTGQGSQYPQMAKQLYACSPVFRMHFEKCQKFLMDNYSINVRSAMWGSNAAYDLSHSLYSQTCIFCVQYCLLKVWESWGVKPDYVLGHSLGEFCACLAAGVLSLEDALTLVAERSRLVESLPTGKMLALKADKTTVEKTLLEHSKSNPAFYLDYAAHNSNEQTVLAGTPENVASFAQFCTSKNIKAHILEASSGFHSRLMDPILEKYKEVVETISKDPVDPQSSCKFISGVYGKLLETTDPDLLSPKYWIDHTREAVNFIGACNVLTNDESCKYFLEIGPQPVLSALMIQNATGGALTCIPSMRRSEESFKTMLGSLGKLYLSGWSIDWSAFDQCYNRKKISSLPTYPFQRKRHWFDTQNVKGYGNSAMNSNELHPLLGSSIANASGAKIFQSGIDIRKRVEYIKDHCVGQRVIFPGAGYLEMALSAGHCITEGLTDTFCRPSGPLTIEHFKILAPLALDEKTVCQMQVVLQNSVNHQEYEKHEKDGMKIQIYRQHLMEGESAKWTEHCVSYFTPAPVDFDEVTFRDNYNFGALRKSCHSELEVGNLYEKLAETGLRFGPSFQSLSKIWKGEHGILAEARVPGDESEYILHPVLLDAMLQTAMIVRSKGTIEQLHVPISIRKFTWLHHDHAANVSSSYFIYSSNVIPLDKDQASNDIISVLFSVNDLGSQAVAFMIGMEFAETTVGALESHLDSQKTDLPTLHNEVWKLTLGRNHSRIDIWEVFKEEALCETAVKALFGDANNLSNAAWEREGLLQRLCYGYILNTFYILGWKPTVGETYTVDEFIKKYEITQEHKKLVRYHMTVLVNEGILKFIGEMELEVVKLPPKLEVIQDLIQQTIHCLEGFENVWNSIQIYGACGSKLAPILQGKESALPILFPQDTTKASAESFYSESYHYSGMDGVATNNFKTLMKPHDPRNSKNVLRILEVGAGTGNFTFPILNLFKEHGTQVEYTFSDISPAFFINAAKKFEDFKDCMKYQVFNVEVDAKTQGFSPGYYDVIVGADVFHATKSLSESIYNVRQLLRPGGMLFLIEGQLHNHITCIFGLLEGYWRFVDTEIRQHHPLVSGDTWKNLCLNNGFDKAIAIPCCKNYYNFVMARASSDDLNFKSISPILSQGGKWIVFPTLDNESKHLLNRLSQFRSVITVWKGLHFQESDDGSRYAINVDNKDHMVKLMNTVKSKCNHIEGIVYLWGLSTGANGDQGDIAQPFLHLCQSVVELKQAHAPKFFLVTSGIHTIGDHVAENPSASTIWGIAKSCANEMNMRIKMIDIAPAAVRQGPQSGLEAADEVFFELWNDTSDLFIAYRDKNRHFCRLMKTKLTEKALKLPQNSRFHLILPKTKMISDLKFGTLGKYNLKPNEIEIRVKSCALNFRDVFAVIKPDPQFDSINAVASDFAGVISACGSEVTKWKVGDAVFGCNLEDGALPSHVRIEEDGVVKKPDSWTFSEACGLPAVFATAYYSLVTVAKMKANDTVLIHTASGGVGLSAIQICQHIGAKVIATAGSSRKRAYLRGIGVRHVFHSRNTNYEEEIMRVTGGLGVDIVLNSLTGPGFKEASLNVCKQNARFVEMSKLSIWQPDEVKALRPDVDYTIVDLTSVPRHVWKMLFETLDDFMGKGAAKPIPYVRFDGVHIREALTYLQKAKHIGKIVCVMPEIQFKSGQFASFTPLFNAESTYLVSGGLGGLGFEVCKWMLDQGANNLVIVNRSHPKEKHMKVIKALRAAGKNIITMSVDVGDPTMCKNLIDFIKSPDSKLPPLRGIMHCAGVLSDATLINQTWEKFLSTFRPKVKGSWNLHELTLDCNLEHFVMFSSMAALFGPPGQSNHSAGNAYLDALVTYRDSVGLPATTINWGQWGSVGVAAGREVRGVVPFSPARGIAALEAILKSQNRQMCVVDLDYLVLMKVHPQSKAYLQHVAGSGSPLDNLGSSLIKSEKFWEEIDSVKDDEKPAIIKQYVKVLLRQILKLDDQEPIDDQASFQDIGLDSLMMIELKNNLQTVLGSRMTFSASAMADCTNVLLLTDKLIQQMYELSEDGNNQPAESRLGLEEMWSLAHEDSILPESLTFQAKPAVPTVFDAKVFLLTGLTGNLGPYILKELLQYSHVSKVYCLFRKTTNPMHRLNQILTDNDLNTETGRQKIKILVGDLTTAQFGLEDNEWIRLSTEVDAVIHCAVKSNHVEQYGLTAMRTVNVFGTLRVLEFCSSQKTKYLFHCSSIVAVSTTDQEGCLSENWPVENELKGVTDLGYPISKMIADRLIHQAVLRGLPAKSFRFGGLIGNSESGRFRHQNNHIMLRFMCYMKLGAMPTIPVPSFLLPVDLAAKTSMRIFFNQINSFSSDIYNVCHPTPALEQEFPVLAKEFGYDVDVVDYNEFVNRFSNEGEDSLLYPFRELYENEERYSSLLSFPDAIRKWLENPDNFFSVRKVSEVIPDYVSSLETTWDYVRRDLNYAKATGLFKKLRLSK